MSCAPKLQGYSIYVSRSSLGMASDSHSAQCILGCSMLWLYVLLHSGVLLAAVMSQLQGQAALVIS